jgi:hypothetical protein
VNINNNLIESDGQRSVSLRLNRRGGDYRSNNDNNQTPSNNSKGNHYLITWVCVLCDFGSNGFCVFVSVQSDGGVMVKQMVEVFLVLGSCQVIIL